MSKKATSRTLEKKSDDDLLDSIYYTHEILKEEGKVACEGCKHISERHDESCMISEEKDTQPEEFYWTLSGSIIGCIYGEEKDVEESKGPS